MYSGTSDPFQARSTPRTEKQDRAANAHQQHSEMQLPFDRLSSRPLQHIYNPAKKVKAGLASRQLLLEQENLDQVCQAVLLFKLYDLSLNSIGHQSNTHALALRMASRVHLQPVKIFYKLGGATGIR